MSLERTVKGQPPDEEAPESKKMIIIIILCLLLLVVGGVVFFLSAIGDKKETSVASSISPKPDITEQTEKNEIPLVVKTSVVETTSNEVFKKSDKAKTELVKSEPEKGKTPIPGKIKSESATNRAVKKKPEFAKTKSTEKYETVSKVKSPTETEKLQPSETASDLSTGKI